MSSPFENDLMKEYSQDIHPNKELEKRDNMEISNQSVLNRELKLSNWKLLL